MSTRHLRSRWFAGSSVIALAVIAGISIAGSIPEASAQQATGESQQSRIDRLQRELTTLQMFVYRGQRGGGGAPAPDTGPIPAQPIESDGSPAVAQLTVRMSDLDNQVRRQIGQSEETNNRISKLEQQLSKLTRDLELRLQQIDERLQQRASAGPAAIGEQRLDTPRAPTASAGPAPAPATAPQAPAVAVASVPPEKVLVGNTPEDRYNYAFGLMRQADYVASEQAMAAFLKLHGQHPLACNAAYWLGESLYVRNDFARAAEAFSDSVQKYPQGCKAPDSLLKLGMSFYALGEKDAACATYGQLTQQFPSAPSNIAIFAARERQRAGCSG